ncbi:polyprenyl synthetase family protein [Cellulomonas taurus]|uniref:polyprenyl synthetase family protein n=1 Tax=Cellulomonas taurus TaxID=2729175 RepID=UPI00145F2AC1|nr:polyprenyl synthetase family protein [Cellulomonas taurus]
MTSSTALPLADPALAERIAGRLDLVENRLRDAAAYADELVDNAAHHLADAGGKRLRPMLTLLAAELGDGERDEVLAAAVVVELTHLASLYHDDVMDSAPLRRGAPAAHEVWGNSVAILVGDLLFSRASTTVADLGPEAVKIQAGTFERLCLGQLHESMGPAEGDDPVQHYLRVLADKTASLIATSARLGAMYGGCSPETVETVAAFGERIGVAFQLADDVIDLSQDGSLSGKTPGTDLREQVPTMPVLLLRERAARDGRAEDVALVELLDSDLSDDADLARAVAALAGHEVVAETRNRALSLVAEAVAILAPLPDGPVKASFISFAEALVNRAS